MVRPARCMLSHLFMNCRNSSRKDINEVRKENQAADSKPKLYLFINKPPSNMPKVDTGMFAKPKR